jgi:hypothetical protein
MHTTENIKCNFQYKILSESQNMLVCSIFWIMLFYSLTNTKNHIKCKCVLKGKAIPVTGHEGPKGCETSRLSHFLQPVGSQLMIRLSALHASHPLPPTPERFLVLISVRGWVASRATVWLEGLGKLKKSTSSGTRTRDLLACSIVPQPTTLPSYSIPSYFMTTNCFSWNPECTFHSWLTEWVKVHQLKNLCGQAVCSPHHLDSARGGQGRPPRRECFSTCRLLVDSPIPQDRLHGDQDPHSPTWHGTARPVRKKHIYYFSHQ